MNRQIHRQKREHDYFTSGTIDPWDPNRHEMRLTLLGGAGAASNEVDLTNFAETVAWVEGMLEESTKANLIMDLETTLEKRGENGLAEQLKGMTVEKLSELKDYLKENGEEGDVETAEEQVDAGPENWGPDKNTTGAKALGKGPKVISSRVQAFNHYYNGDGSAVKLGENVLLAVTEHPKTRKKLEKIYAGNTDSKGSWSVNFRTDIHLQWLGNTNVYYSVHCPTSEKCIVKLDIFKNDSFSDVKFWLESINKGYLRDFMPGWRPDGIGPNLELDSGKPYMFIPTVIYFQFDHPGTYP